MLLKCVLLARKKTFFAGSADQRSHIAVKLTLYFLNPSSVVLLVLPVILFLLLFMKQKTQEGWSASQPATQFLAAMPLLYFIWNFLIKWNYEFEWQRSVGKQSIKLLSSEMHANGRMRALLVSLPDIFCIWYKDNGIFFPLLMLSLFAQIGWDVCFGLSSMFFL